MFYTGDKSFSHPDLLIQMLEETHFGLEEVSSCPDASAQASE